MSTCPKCGTEYDENMAECPKCGIIFAKYISQPKKLPASNPNMAKCKACGQNISQNAMSCPHCGEPGPSAPRQKADSDEKKQKNRNKGCGCGCATIIVLFFFLWAYNSIVKHNKSEQPPVPQLTEAEKAAKDAAAKKKRAEEHEKCKLDLNCWGNKHSGMAIFKCQERIERFAKYQFEWTDGVLGSKLTRFRWKDQANLTVTYIGDSLKFQNGFGAWQNMIYECDYDPVNDIVLDVRVSPGKF